MAIITTSKALTVSLVHTHDPAVVLSQSAYDRLTAPQVAARVKAARDSLPDDATDEKKAAAADQVLSALAALPPRSLQVPGDWVPVSDCDSAQGATTVAIRALSWLEYESARALAAHLQVQRIVELGVVAVNGSADEAKAFIADPVAHLIPPLYQRIADLSWGNSRA